MAGAQGPRRLALLAALAATALALPASESAAEPASPAPPLRPVDARLTGGSKYDYLHCVAAGPDGTVAAGGMTGDRDLPLRRALQVRWSDTSDGYLLQVDGTGARVLFCTWLGGSRWDSVHSCAVGPDGSLYAAGATWSPDFPATDGALQEGNPEEGRAFLARIDPRKGEFLFSALLDVRETMNIDARTPMAVAGDGSVVLAGRTTASRIGASPDGPDFHPGADVAFVGRVAADGRSFLWRVPLPSHEGTVEPAAVALSPDGSVLVTGTVGRWRDNRSPAGPPRMLERNAFAARLTAGGTLAWFRVPEREGFSQGDALVVDAEGVAWIAGTAALKGGFPSRREEPGPTGIRPGSRIFLLRLDPAGKELSRCVIEGSVHEDRPSLALRPGGGVFVAGRTGSPELGADASGDDGDPAGPMGRRFVVEVDAEGEVGEPFLLRLPPTEFEGPAAAAPDGDLFVATTLTTPRTRGVLVRCSSRPGAAAGKGKGRGPVLPRLPGWGPTFDLPGVDVAEEEGKGREGSGAGEAGEPGSPGGEGGPAAAGGGEAAGGGPVDGGGGVAAEDTLEVHRGILRDRLEAERDFFLLEARLRGEAEPGEGLDAFDPGTMRLCVTAGDRLYPLVIEIPPGDPGWKERKEVLLWESPEDGKFRVSLRLQRDTGRFTLTARGFDFPGPQANPVAVTVEGLSNLGTHAARWKVRGEGRLEFK